MQPFSLLPPHLRPLPLGAIHAVVEFMFSLEVLVATLGDPQLADRLERIAYNALPATFAPDMWSHQYVQQANQVLCAVAEERVYTNNSADANIFGCYDAQD